MKRQVFAFCSQSYSILVKSYVYNPSISRKRRYATENLKFYALNFLAVLIGNHAHQFAPAVKFFGRAVQLVIFAVCQNFRLLVVIIGKGRSFAFAVDVFRVADEVVARRIEAGRAVELSPAVGYGCLAPFL